MSDETRIYGQDGTLEESDPEAAARPALEWMSACTDEDIGSGEAMRRIMGITTMRDEMESA